MRVISLNSFLLVAVLAGCATAPETSRPVERGCETYVGFATNEKRDLDIQVEICRKQGRTIDAEVLSLEEDHPDILNGGLFLLEGFFRWRKTALAWVDFSNSRCDDYRFDFRWKSSEKLRGAYSSTDCAEDGLLFLERVR